MKVNLRTAVGALLLCCCADLRAADSVTAAEPVRTPLFMTGFEQHQTGPDTLAGMDGWSGTSRGQGLHGVDPAGSGGIGRSGYIGRNTTAPGVGFVSVRHPVGFAPLVTGETRGPVVEFYAIVGIADSTNGRRDNFYITLYDDAGGVLGAVNFDNTQERFGIYRYDGTNYHRSVTRYVRGRVHELTLRVNYATGYWSAALDRLPVFQNAKLDFTRRQRTLGSVAAEWEISTAGQPGNNWMLFDEWTVRAATETPLAPLVIRPGVAGAAPQVSWEEEAGYIYRLWQSRDLRQWDPAVPETPAPAVEGGEKMTALPQVNPAPTSLFWRLERTRPPL